MTTIFAFSDIHEKTLPQYLLDIAAESDYVFFLGDGAARLGELVLHKNFYGVAGNCDSLPLPKEVTLDVEGVKILLTHGHAYGVKSDCARKNSAAVLCVTGTPTPRKSRNATV